MYDNANEMVKDQENETQQPSVKLATVTELFEDGCPKIKFYGEDTASEKEYSYLATYIPAVNDTVVLAKTDNSYIILGKINHKIAPDTKIDDDYINGKIDEYLDTQSYVTLQSDGTIYLDAANYYNYLRNIKTVNILNTGYFRHQGSNFGVFGKEPRGQYSLTTLSESVDYTSAQTLSTQVKNALVKINDIIVLLRGFGFSS